MKDSSILEEIQIVTDLGIRHTLRTIQIHRNTSRKWDCEFTKMSAFGSGVARGSLKYESVSINQEIQFVFAVDSRRLPTIYTRGKDTYKNWKESLRQCHIHIFVYSIS